MQVSNFLSYTPIFTGIKKEQKPVHSDGEQMDFLADKASKVMAERIENEVPENGKFTKLSVSWDIPKTLNKAILAVEADALEPKNSRRLAVGAYRKGSDNIRLGYISKGTKKEILEYIKNSDNKEKIIETAYQLSDSVDEHYSELY